MRFILYVHTENYLMAFDLQNFTKIDKKIVLSSNQAEIGLKGSLYFNIGISPKKVIGYK